MFYKLLPELEEMKGLRDGNSVWYLIGEIFGANVQDLSYGLSDPDFRAFDFYEGFPGQGHYVNAAASHPYKRLFKAVPEVFVGPFDPDLVGAYTPGDSLLMGAHHIREGVVIRPMQEREDNKLGRVILKSVSEDYLLRKGGTELE